jgi:hypothetical protein
MRIAAFAPLLALAVACSPKYDWRELRPAGLDCVVTLPGKPAAMSRAIDLDGVPVTMTMHGTRVDDTSFAVAMAVLPGDDPQTRANALSAMQRGMLRNIGAAAAQPRDVEVAVVDAAGARIAGFPAQRIDATGSANGRPVRLVAGFAARGARAWQWTVIGGSIDEEQALAFVDSFRLAEAGRR